MHITNRIYKEFLSINKKKTYPKMGKIQKRISKWPMNMKDELFNLISFQRNENPMRYYYIPTRLTKI